MSEKRTYQYDAFISYRHKLPDKTIAEKLQKMLETYRPPKNIQYKNTKRIKRVFRDTSELPTSGDLGGDIREALRESRFLIVVFSEETAQSRWCMEEIRYFKELHGGRIDKILPIVISGNPENIFPEELRFETIQICNENGENVQAIVEVEPLAANVSTKHVVQSLCKLKTEFLRIAAPILGCTYDDLYRRHRRRMFSNFMLLGVGVLAFLLVFGSYYIANRTVIKTQNTAANISIVQDLLEDGDLVKAQLALHTVILENENLSDYLKSQLYPLLMQATYVPQYTSYTVLEHQESIEQVLFSDDEAVCYVASNNQCVTLWDSDTGEKITTLMCDNSAVYMEIVGDFLYLATEQKTLEVWNLNTFEREKVIDYDQNSGTNLFFYEVADIMVKDDFVYIAEAFDFYYIQKINLTTGEYEYVKKFDDMHISYTNFCFDEIHDIIFLVNFYDGDEYLIYDLETQEMQVVAHEWVDSSSASFPSITYDKQTGTIYQLYDNSSYIEGASIIFVECTNIIDQTVVKAENIKESVSGTFDWWSLCISPDGLKLGLTFNDGENVLAIELEDIADAAFLMSLESNLQFISNSICYLDIAQADSVAVSSAMNKLASWDKTGRVRLYNIITDEAEITSAVQSDAIFAVNKAYPEYMTQTNQMYASADFDMEQQAYFQIMNEACAVSSDGKYRVVEVASSDIVEHIANQGNGEYISYWLIDTSLNEVLYNINIPCRYFLAIDIKDDEIGTLLTAENYIYIFNMETGEVLESYLLSTDIGNTEIDLDSCVRFEVDYTNEYFFVANEVSEDSWSGTYSIGGLYSLEDGSLICDFSPVTKNTYLGCDEKLTKIYMVTNTEDALTGTIYTIPTFEELLDRLENMIGDRSIDVEEKEMLGLK